MNHPKRIFAALLVIIGLILWVLSADMGIYTLRQQDLENKAFITAQKNELTLKDRSIIGNLLYYTAVDADENDARYLIVFRKSTLIDLYQALAIQQPIVQSEGSFETQVSDQNTTYTFIINMDNEVVVKSQNGKTWESSSFEPLLLYMIAILVIYPFVFKKKKPSNR